MTFDKFKKLELFYNNLQKGFDINVEFTNELMFSKNELTITKILEILSEKIKQLDYFKNFAFYTIENNVDFKLSICSDEKFSDDIELDVEKHIDNGTFSWVLHNNRHIIINGPVSKNQQLLISIATNRRIHGMFIAVANDDVAITGIVQDVISLLITIAAQSIDNNELKIQLLNYNIKLEDDIKIRTAELEESKNKAEQSAKSKLEFLANMSHEIRTPMNGVLGMLELLNKSKLDSAQKNQVDTAYQSGQNMMVILNDILELSKFEAGKIVIENNEFNLINLIEDVVAMFLKKANENEVELICFIDTEVPEIVFGAQTRVWQIIMNLLGNAVKFTKSGSIILTVTIDNANDDDFALCVEIKDTGIGISDEAKNLIFNPFEQAEVNTTRHFGGTGLGLALCKRLVDLLGGEIKLDSTVGVGSTFSFIVNLSVVKFNVDKCLPKNVNVLYVCDSEFEMKWVDALFCRLAIKYKIVSDKDSALKELIEEPDKLYSIVMLCDPLLSKCYEPILSALESNAIYDKGKFILVGSFHDITEMKFSHVLPKPFKTSEIIEIITSENIDTPDTESNEEIVIENSGSVLLVEDNEVNQLVATGMLEKMGITPDIACDGVEALELVSKNKYDLILMDINMPNMDGYAATTEIRKKEDPKEHIPIIALTANVLQEDVDGYYKVGMDDFLAKPYSYKNIEACLKKWIKKDSSNDVETIDLKGDRESSSFINLETIHYLQEIMGDAINELFETFIDRSGTMVNEIMENPSDLEKIKFNIHNLKGSSGNIGAQELFRLCELIENMIIKNQVLKIDSYLHILKHELSGVHSELNSLMLK